MFAGKLSLHEVHPEPQDPYYLRTVVNDMLYVPLQKYEDILNWGSGNGNGKMVMGLKV